MSFYLSLVLSLPNNLLIPILLIYKKFISPNLTPSCRFSPTCSEYSLSAFQTFGFWKAFTLTAIRILKCNPYFQGGYDPIPIHNHKECIHGR